MKGVDDPKDTAELLDGGVADLSIIRAHPGNGAEQDLARSVG